MDTTPGQRVAAEIRAEMARQGVTSSTVAQTTDIARSTLHRKLTGRSEFNLAEAAAVCAALGISLAEIVRRAEASEVAA